MICFVFFFLFIDQLTRCLSIRTIKNYLVTDNNKIKCGVNILFDHLPAKNELRVKYADGARMAGVKRVPVFPGYICY